MKVTAGGKDTVGDMERVGQSTPASYTIWKDGSTYRAECNLKDGTDYSGTNALTIVQSAIDALPNGGRIVVRAAVYEMATPPTITTDNLCIEGEVAGRNQKYFLDGPTEPLDAITKGTVFKITSSGQHGIVISGKRSGITLKNITIDFSQAATGNGIHCPAATGNIGLTFFNFEDILVNRVDGGHHALYMESFGQGCVRYLTSYGGGLLNLVLTTTAPLQYNCGNTIFDQLFAYTTKTFTTYPVFIHRTSASGVLNLMVFNRLQLQPATGHTLGAVVGVNMDQVYYTQFNNIDLETAGDYSMSISNSGYITFVEPFVYNSTTWSIAASVDAMRVFGGYLNLNVKDLSTTNRYFGTAIGDVDALTVAKLLECQEWTGASWALTENRGLATILNGGTSVIVTHGLRTTPTMVMLTGSHEEVHESYVSAFGAGTFTITVDGAVSANRAVYWEASSNK